VVLSDPEWVADPAAAIFSLGYWRARGAVTGSATGRGSVWFVKAQHGQWALRHYRRGGLVGRLISDHYLYLGQSRVRSFSEWRLLAELFATGLPVPRPVAASYTREGPFYTCDLITERLSGTETLASLLLANRLGDADWRQVGRVAAGFHARGVDHADLNAHNILLDEQGQVFWIDFDRAWRHPPGAWQASNLARLKRSLYKICPPTRNAELAAAWVALTRGYKEGAPNAR